MPSLPPTEWSVGDLTLRDVRPAEAGLVEALHRSRSEVGRLDPSFNPCDSAEYQGLVADSVAGSREGNPFKLRIICAREPVGYFHVTEGVPDEGSLLVGMFLIDPRFAGQGYGKSAAEGLAEQARLMGHRRILLKVHLANADALRFWVRCGFDRIHAFRNAKEGESSSLILERPLKL